MVLCILNRQMFKGPTQDIDAIYTAPSSAMCGVTLDTNGRKEYIITGILRHDHLFIVKLKTIFKMDLYISFDMI